MARNKYGNIPVLVDGKGFDSKKEAARYRELQLLQAAGEIKNLRCQPRYELQSGFVCAGKKIRKIEVVWDFYYDDCVGANSQPVVEDVKSAITRANQVYRLKLKLFLFKYRGEIEFREVV